MKIDHETVDKIATLARLELSADEKVETIKDMNRILDFMDKLNEVDTEAVEPLVYMNADANVLREDIVKQEVSHEEALLNAPKKDENFFHVAKVIG